MLQIVSAASCLWYIAADRVSSLITALEAKLAVPDWRAAVVAAVWDADLNVCRLIILTV